MKLRDHLEKLDETISKISEILGRQEEQLAFHIKRTNLLEESLDILRNEVRPITAHMAAFNALCKIVTIGLGLAGGGMLLVEAYLRLKALP